MFWGLIVEPGKKYSQKVFQSFHISQAVLDVKIIKGDPDVQLILSSTNCGNGNTIDYILCVLKKSGTVQVPLNLLFSKGEDISLRSVGATVHLSGYSVDERNFRDWCDEDETYDGRHTDRRQMAQESGDEEDDSDEDSSEEEDRSDEDSSEEEDSSDDEDEVDNNSDNDSIEKEQPTSTPMKKPNGIPKEHKKPKVVENKIRQLGGVRIEDMRKGKGPAVRSGRKVGICFNCTLQSNNISIHKHSSGKEYVFTVGKGEVIQGWDIGIVGMRPGGKRKLICPPEKAFGAKGTQPAISPDATLVYEIELMRVL